MGQHIFEDFVDIYPTSKLFILKNFAVLWKYFKQEAILKNLSMKISI